MSLYTVTAPCAFISNGQAVHHTRPSAKPVEVDDDVAAPLVESGALTPVSVEGVEGVTGTVLDGAQTAPSDPAPAAAPPASVTPPAEQPAVSETAPAEQRRPRRTEP